MCNYSFELNNSNPSWVHFTIFSDETGRQTEFMHGTVFWDKGLELRPFDKRAVFKDAPLDWERFYEVVNWIVAAAQMEMAKIK